MNPVGAQRYVPPVNAIFSYEWRRCGTAAWALPVLGALAGGTGVLAVGILSEHPMAQAGAVRVLAAGFPVLAGVAVVAALGRERMLELQASTATPLPATLGRRLCVVALAVAAAVAALSCAALVVQGPGAAVRMLALPAPCALLAGTALWAWVRWLSTAVASSAVAGVWLAHMLWWDSMVPPLLNRPVSLLAGGALIAWGLRCANDTERLMRGGAAR